MRTGFGRVGFYAAGDFGRIFKIGLAFFIVGLTAVRIIYNEALPLQLVVVAALAMIIVESFSVASSRRRIDFVIANEFTDPDRIIRKSRSIHIGEVVAIVVWVAWLAMSLGGFDALLFAIFLLTFLWAFLQRRRLERISRPRNVWEN